jgi:predicted small lipoprotein YifL
MLPKIFFTKGFYLILIFLVASCGQKGELYLPDDHSKQMMETSLLQLTSTKPVEQNDLDE